MQGHYGTRFLNMWKTGQVLPDGNDAGIVNAMNHWAEKLGWYVDHPQTIKTVLDNLPTEPPTLPQFCDMLRRAWRPPEQKMIERKFSHEEIEQNKKRVHEMLDQLCQKIVQKNLDGD
jgi:hypothetical protein